MLRSLSRLVIAIALGAPLAAQIDPVEVAFTGVVEKFSGVGTCVAPTHVLACSDGTFFLVSSTLDLDLYVGKNVKLYATKDDICHINDVHGVEEPPPATLAICGTGGLGCPIRLRSGPGGISQHALWVSLKPDFLPLNPNKGSFLLAQPFYLIGL